MSGMSGMSGFDMLISMLSKVCRGGTATLDLLTRRSPIPWLRRVPFLFSEKEGAKTDSSLQLDSLLAEEKEYQDFVDKFKPKRTTDDCYTPENVYACVRDWVLEKYNLPKAMHIARPFWPGGNYQTETYPEGCVVIDNPPFSILNEIELWFEQSKIQFFLFAPALTIFKPHAFLNYVMIDQSIVYQNGAEVATSFVTNMGDNMIEAATDLERKLKVINDINRRRGKAELPKYAYPENLLMVSDVRKYAKYGVQFHLKRESACFVRKIDANRAKGLFGGGFIISDKAAADKAAADKAAADKAAADKAAADKAAAEQKKINRYTLSEREKQIVKKLV